MNKVISFVIDVAEKELDPIIAAAIGEIDKAGHVLKEIRVMSDAGEVKVARENVAGAPAAPTQASPPAAEPTTPTEAPATATETPVTAPTAEAPADVPTDTPPAPAEAVSPLKQREQELLDELAALRQQEEQDAATTVVPPADPTPPSDAAPTS